MKLDLPDMKLRELYRYILWLENRLDDMGIDRKDLTLEEVRASLKNK